MSPFAIYLETLRRSRKLQQQQLADMMGINPSYISSMERGHKGPPSQKILNSLIETLNLNAQEEALLREKAALSEQIIKLPANLSNAEYELMGELKKHFGTISDDQVQIITRVLNLGTNIKAKKWG